MSVTSLGTFTAFIENLNYFNVHICTRISRSIKQKLQIKYSTLVDITRARPQRTVHRVHCSLDLERGKILKRVKILCKNRRITNITRPNGPLNVKTLEKESLEWQNIETLQVEIVNSICTGHYETCENNIGRIRAMNITPQFGYTESLRRSFIEALILEK